MNSKKKQEHNDLLLRQEFIDTFSGCLSFDDDEDDIGPKLIWERNIE